MSSKTKDLAKNTVIVTIGKICTQFLNFFLLPVFTALLTKEQYGTADLYLNYVILLVPLVTMQLDMGLFRFLIDSRQEPQKQKILMTSAFFCQIGQVVLCAAIYLIARQFTDNVNLMYLLLNIIVASFVAMLQQAARGFGDNTGYAFSAFLAAAAQIAVNILLICGLGMRTEAMYIAYFIGNGVCVVYLSVRLKIFRFISRKQFSLPQLRELLSYSIPLVPNAISWWFVNTADRTVVATFLGTAANGLLAISHKFSSLYTMGINIFVYPWTESASLHFHEPDRDEFFKSVIYTMFRFFYSACIGIIAVLPFVFSFIIDAQFAESYYQIPFFMISALLNTVVGLYSVVFQATKKTMFLASTSLVAGMVSIFVDILLIPYIGLYAPAVASVCAYLVFLLIRYKAARKYINVPLEKSVVLSGLIVLAYVLPAYYIDSLILRISAFCTAAVYAVVVNLPWVKEIIKPR